MKLIVGLGNPGKKYFNTRHNIGFLCLDKYAHDHNLKFKKHRKFKAEVAEISGAILLKPQTYMNLSGFSVVKALDYYGIDKEDIFVIYDDLDLPTAKIRLRYQGSSGGHKGMMSLFDHLKTKEIKRLKFGIDRHPELDAKEYVLQPFYKVDLDEVLKSINTVSKIIDDFINDKPFNQIMTEYN